MGNRRFAQVSTSDEDNGGDAAPATERGARNPSPSPEKKMNSKKKRRMKKLGEDDEDDYEVEEEELSEEVSEEEDDEEEEAEEEVEQEESRRKRIPKKKKDDEVEEEDEDEASQSGGGEEEEEDEEDEEEEEDVQVDAKPVGEPVKVTGKGKSRRTHFEAFEYDGNQYDLEDPVLITPEGSKTIQKPYVAIIKDVTQDKDGNVMMTGQWFYRPEEADKKSGGNWLSDDTRELFYSFHRDDVPAESVMHKCVVHFVPLHKQLPNRKQYPGFIVRKVYDTVERKLWKLTDKDYEDKKQHEIDLLVQKTMKRLIDLPDIEPEENNVTEQEDLAKSKRIFRKKNIAPLDISRDEELTKPEQTPNAETPGSCLNNASEYYRILVNLQCLTGDSHRDKWLERLLQGVEYVCTNNGEAVKDDTNGGKHGSDCKSSDSSKSSLDKSLKEGQGLVWPDAAVQAVTALEKASHESFLADYQKYNQKLRQLLFNLKNNALLARRLLNGELEAAKILSMTPTELKEGLTAEETAKKEPDDSERMQMTDARCTRCSEFKVGVRDIIKAGHNERYQLECIACGHSWYASRDEAASLTVDAPSSAKTVGTSPLATAKFDNIEKQLANPAEADDLLKKTSEAFLPVLDAPKPVTKINKDENL